MTDKGTIRMKYKDALRQADSLVSMADRMESQGVSKMNEVISSLRSDWKGDNAESYLRKCEALQENVKKTVTKVRRTADGIRKIAKNTYDSEMQNYEIAKKRTYS